MRPLLLCSLLAIATAVGASTAFPQTLRGSQASVNRMYGRALSRDLDFFRTSRGLTDAITSGEVVLINVTPDVALEDVSYPFVLPATLRFVNDIAARFRAACGERLVVTSAVRPRVEQPRNASPKSVHPTGMAVDFRRPTGTCLTWLRAELLRLERTGAIEATEERRPPHFHVAVFRASGATPARVVADRTQSPAEARQPSTYVVRAGDTLSEIAQQFGVTTKQLRAINGLAGTRIRVGQRLRLR